MYNRNSDFFHIEEVIGMYGRLSIDEELEMDFRSIFDFFAGGE